MKKIVAVNAGPRNGWNTDRLVREATKGAESMGAEVTYVSLYQLEKFTGCMSCFACKREESYGKCVLQDGLTDVLKEIRESDGLIIGSPNYLANMTAGFRAIYERMLFESLTYRKENVCCREKRIPVLMITTSNFAEELYSTNGYNSMLEVYRTYFNKYMGPAEILVCGDTLQVNDYSRYNWTMFDPEHKKAHHEATFDSYLQKAYEMGKALSSGF